MATRKRARTLDLDYFRGRGHTFHFATTEIEAGADFFEHTHAFHELFWIDHGEAVHRVNGEERIIRPGSLVFVRADDQHSFTGLRSTLHLHNLAFPAEHWAALSARYFAEGADPLRAGPIRAREYRVGADDSGLLELFKRDLFQCNDRGPLALDRVLLNIAHMAARAPRGDADAGDVPEWLAAACRGIAAREYFSQGPAGFVELAGRSPEHVARAARHYLGRTPGEIVNDARLTWAAQRLGGSDQPILDVAYDCGLSNLSHFYRLFRAKYGMTPKRYRQAQRGIFDARR